MGVLWGFTFRNKSVVPDSAVFLPPNALPGHSWSCHHKEFMAGDIQGINHKPKVWSIHNRPQQQLGCCRAQTMGCWWQHTQITSRRIFREHSEKNIPRSLKQVCSACRCRSCHTHPYFPFFQVHFEASKLLFRFK